MRPRSLINPVDERSPCTTRTRAPRSIESTDCRASSGPRARSFHTACTSVSRSASRTAMQPQQSAPHAAVRQVETQARDQHEHERDRQPLVRQVGGEQHARQRQVDHGADREERTSRPDGRARRPASSRQRDGEPDGGDQRIGDPVAVDARPPASGRRACPADPNRPGTPAESQVGPARRSTRAGRNGTPVATKSMARAANGSFRRVHSRCTRRPGARGRRARARTDGRRTAPARTGRDDR